MDHTASKGAGTEISPAIRREFGEVRSIRTATNSHESPSLLLSVCSFSAVEEEEEEEGGEIAALGLCSCHRVSDTVVVVDVDRVADGVKTNAVVQDTAAFQPLHSNNTAAAQELFIMVRWLLS